MGEESHQPTGPDLSQGIRLDSLAEGTMLPGHVGEETVLLTRLGGEVFAVGATCTHYSGPLAEGLQVGETVRCPWHHACFSLRTGEALRAPALSPLPRRRVEQRNGMVYVREKLDAAALPPSRAGSGSPGSVVIVGGGGAGNAAAEMLRREGYAGRLTLLSADEAPPCDRPNLSKDYLAGTAQEDWIPLHPPAFYRDRDIELTLGARVAAIDPKQREVRLADGSRHGYDALLLATGAEPVRLDIPGADQPHVRYLRTLADSRALVGAAEKARKAAVIGASFIGLEVAASLRARGIEVSVIAPEARPMQRVMGEAIGDMIRAIHETHGVSFHLSTTAAAIDAQGVTLADGQRVAADLVVVGIGVRPMIALAEQAGLETDRGVLVDEFLETSIPGIFAAGDIARWPDKLTGERIRVEHWVVAERQGQTAARNILGRRERFRAVPFFWSQHYDTTISYVGHAAQWDRIDIEGEPMARDYTATFWRGGRKLAAVTVGRDLESLRAEVELEGAVAA